MRTYETSQRYHDNPEMEKGLNINMFVEKFYLILRSIKVSKNLLDNS